MTGPNVHRQKFVRERLPDWIAYADAQGLELTGKGSWRSTLCPLHDDHSPSLRVNTESGGWCCMSCGCSGGDTLSFHMQRYGADFLDAARELGAVDAGARSLHQQKRAALSARDALAVLHLDALFVFVYASNLSQGVVLTEEDRRALNDCVRRIGLICSEMRS